MTHRTEQFSSHVYDVDVSNSFVSNRIHAVFVTKGRGRFLTPSLRARLYPYLSATARELGIEMIALGGVEDHLHVLFALPSTMTLSQAIQKLKANSSRWINETFETKKFAWQEGYGAFSVGASAIPAVKEYIALQGEHHKKRDFGAEFEAMLRQHGIDPTRLPSSGLVDS